MYDKENLHWSFNHSRKGQEDFGTTLTAAARSYLQSREKANARDGSFKRIASTYVVLPNFWRGYLRRADGAAGEKRLDIGRLTIHRELEKDSTWSYSVVSENRTSGENLRSRFQCKDDQWRSLLDGWQIEAENHAGNLHKTFRCEGCIRDTAGGEREVRLKVDGLDFVSGKNRDGLPLTCTWALYDLLIKFKIAKLLLSIYMVIKTPNQ